jgi:hypothetical protein
VYAATVPRCGRPVKGKDGLEKADRGMDELPWSQLDSHCVGWIALRDQLDWTGAAWVSTATDFPALQMSNHQRSD